MRKQKVAGVVVYRVLEGKFKGKVFWNTHYSLKDLVQDTHKLIRYHADVQVIAVYDNLNDFFEDPRVI